VESQTNSGADGQEAGEEMHPSRLRNNHVRLDGLGSGQERRRQHEHTISDFQVGGKTLDEQPGTQGGPQQGRPPPGSPVTTESSEGEDHGPTQHCATPTHKEKIGFHCCLLTLTELFT
jgi:hypothetical protein